MKLRLSKSIKKKVIKKDKLRSLILNLKDISSFSFLYFFSSLFYIFLLSIYIITANDVYMTLIWIISMMIILIIIITLIFLKRVKFKEEKEKSIEELIDFIDIKGKKRNLYIKEVIRPLKLASNHDENFQKYKFGILALFIFIIISIIPIIIRELYLMLFFGYIVIYFIRFRILVSIGLIIGYFFLVNSSIRLIHISNVEKITFALYEIIHLKIKKTIDDIEKAINSPLENLHINSKFVREKLDQWNRLYEGRFYNNQEFNELLTENRDLYFSYYDEIDHYKMLSNLKYKINEIIIFNESKVAEYDKIIRFLENSLQKVTISLKTYETFYREKRDRGNYIIIIASLILSIVSITVTILFNIFKISFI